MGIYKSVVEIATPYFGIGAQKFVDRQIRSHLSIEPDALEAKHIDELVKWCLLSGKLFLQDDKAATEMCNKISKLKR